MATHIHVHMLHVSLYLVFYSVLTMTSMLVDVEKGKHQM